MFDYQEDAESDSPHDITGLRAQHPRTDDTHEQDVHIYIGQQLTEARRLLREVYSELSGNSNYLEKRLIEGFFKKYPRDYILNEDGEEV